MLDLLRRCQSRDPQAQRQLFELYGERLYRVAYRYTLDQMEAEDTVTEAFIKIFQHLEDTHFAHRNAFEAWIRKITINQALEIVRKRKRWQAKMVAESMLVPEKEESTLEGLRLPEVLALIDRLPKGYRTVLQLFALEGYTHGEIAKALGISIGASKSQLSKARAYLHQQLKKANVS